MLKSIDVPKIQSKHNITLAYQLRRNRADNWIIVISSERGIRMRDNGSFNGGLCLVVYAMELIYAATQPGSVVDGGDEELAQRFHSDYSND